MKLELFMVLLEEKEKETVLAEMKFETQTAGTTVIIAGHKANETAEMSAIGFSV